MTRGATRTTYQWSIAKFEYEEGATALFRHCSESSDYSSVGSSTIACNCITHSSQDSPQTYYKKSNDHFFKENEMLLEEGEPSPREDVLRSCMRVQ